MSEQPKQSDDNIVADWKGADEIEQHLQGKIRSNMESQEPKIEHELNRDDIIKLLEDFISQNRSNSYEEDAAEYEVAVNGVLDRLEELLEKLKK